jgi:transketolase
MSTTFPIDLSQYRQVAIDPWATETLTDKQREDLQFNIDLCRDAIVFFTATGAAKGLGGHTGGPYDTVPEVMLLDAMFRGAGDKFVPVFWDEAGHRVATQYLMAAIHGDLPAEQLMKYREADSKLPGHPELGLTPGVKFSSGRLGHVWPFVNGIALANPDKVVVMLGSDGSQMEGNDAEAARLAVAQNLNVKLVLDDNDVTIAGHPSEYLPGFDLITTLEGHGLTVHDGDGEDLDDLYNRLRQAITEDGPVAVINERKMAVGIDGLEGSAKGHDVISVDLALKHLEQRGRDEAVAALKAIEKPSAPKSFQGSGDSWGSNRNVFGEAVVEVMHGLSETDLNKVICIDSDLEGSCGLQKIREAFPQRYVSSGVMERGNFSAAAGFGFEAGYQGIFGTFSAFLEMCISELTMARLNKANAICHFSHAGVDDMADNTCHFGLNNFFADNGLDDDHHPTRLYFPADANQMRAVIKAIYGDPGLRFVFSTRSKTPNILDGSGGDLFGGDYTFAPGKDEVVRDGTAGFIVSYGDALYRSLDAVEKLNEAGIDVGLINKPTLNVVDEDVTAKIGQSPFVVVVEPLNRRTGLGSRMGTWLLERGFGPKFARLGTWREGCGGLWEQYPYQGIDPDSIIEQVKKLA